MEITKKTTITKEKQMSGSQIPNSKNKNIYNTSNPNENKKQLNIEILNKILQKPCKNSQISTKIPGNFVEFWNDLKKQQTNLGDQSNSDEKQQENFQKLQYYFRMGSLPDQLRPKAWLFIINQSGIKKLQSKKDTFKILMESPSSQDIYIEKDVPRTFSEYQFFKQETGKTYLFNILRAYSNYDQTMGYAQGFSFIAGSILLILNPDNYKDIQESFDTNAITALDYQEMCFWVLVYICQNQKQRDFYLSGANGLLNQIQILKNKLEKILPNILKHCVKFDEQFMLQLISYYLTIMSIEFPLEFQKRVLDVFLLEGLEVVDEIILAQFQLCQKQILSINNWDQFILFLKYEFIKTAYSNQLNNI